MTKLSLHEQLLDNMDKRQSRTICYILSATIFINSFLFIIIFTIPGAFSNSQVQFERSAVCENASDLFLGATSGKQ